MRRSAMLQVNKQQVYTLSDEIHEALDDIKRVKKLFLTEQLDNSANTLVQNTELSDGFNSQYDMNLIYRGASFAFILKIIKKLDRAAMRVDSLKDYEEI